MRRVQVLAGVVMLPALLTACTERPNDLYTYYDDPTSSSVATSQAPAPTSATPTSSAAPRQADPSVAAWTATDLVEEEVQPDGPPVRAALTTLPDCAVPLPAAESALQTSWKYASGSQLRQYVAIYPAGAATVVDALRTARTCATFTAADGQRYTLEPTQQAPTTGTDAQDTWCATTPRRSTCTVVLAKDKVLSVITVSAATLPRAQSAITRLAPLAAAKLAKATN